jgi:uncharacterized RDD family membrane protein YckC
VTSNSESLPNGIVLAPLWRRGFATLIDVLVAITFLASVAATAGGLVFAMSRVARRGVSVSERLRRGLRRCSDWAMPLGTPRRLSLPVRLALAIPAYCVNLRRRNKQSLGARVMGIRRVESQTGGPVTLRSALIRAGAFEIVKLTRKAAIRPLSDRSRARFAELRPERRELEREHAGDPAALQDALMDMYREGRINLLAPMGWLALSIAAVDVLPLLTSSSHQSLPDRLAGIVVVVDEPRNLDH